MRRLASASVVVIATAAALTGCSSGTTTTSGATTVAPTTAADKAPATTDAKTTTTKGSTGSTGTTGTTAVGAAATKAVGALLVVGDLPGTWNGHPPKTDDPKSTNQTFFGTPACSSLATVPAADLAASPQVSVAFDNDTESLQNEIDVYPGSSGATAFVSLLQNADFGSCLKATLEASDSSGSSTSVGTPQISDLPVPSASELGVDSVSASQATIAIAETTTVSGSAPRAESTVIQIYALQKGNALEIIAGLTVALGGQTAPPPVDLTSTVKTAAQKLVAAY